VKNLPWSFVSLTVRCTFGERPTLSLEWENAFDIWTCTKKYEKVDKMDNIEKMGHWHKKYSTKIA